MIEIIGAEGEINNVEEIIKKLSRFSLKYNVVVQAVDAEMVYGKNHLISAAEHAIRSFKENKNTTKSLAMEILLYAAGVRQIGDAISKMGIKEKSKGIALVIIHSIPDLKIGGSLSWDDIKKLIGELKLKLNDDILEGNEAKMRKFGISKEEKATVEKDKYEDLVLEKVAMVDIIK